MIERGLRLDLELVSWIFAKPEMHHWIDLYKRDLMPHGIRFFGHGHTHALHDTMDFEPAYDSFSTNFRLMREWGLEPKAYAYPGSSGKRRSTQAANRLAGFICARGSTLQREDYFIAPGELAEPDNWYFLPSVIMGNASFQYIDVHEKLVPILDEAVERTAWIILMYHAIGIPEGWSYYPIKDFLRDLDAIIARDFWSANMDAAACYLAERASVRFSITDISGTRDATVLQVHVDDQLPDNIYDQPLTIMIRSKYAVGALEGALISVQHIDDTRVTAELLPDGSTFTVQVLNRSI
ncbi:MAG: hypothetical protein VX733_07690 [Candidatus Latescibacterota bacterium]|nr:hypothetical protein [Candidatus Latescibacterota bacterium]